MCGAGTARVINNNEKLGLPWIWCSIYNAHLAQHPDPCSSPRKSGAHSQPRRVLLFLSGALQQGRSVGSSTRGSSAAPPHRDPWAAANGTEKPSKILSATPN